jgi:CRISPR/Cas system CMR-associated protein Cmr1 (group 7 of RAMP superfamily)
MKNKIISKKFQEKIKREVQDLEKLSNKNWKKITDLEIRMYNPNSKWNQQIFRKHKYECKIYIGDEVLYLEEEHSFKHLVEKIGLCIDK